MPNSKQPNLILISFDDAVAYWKYRSVFGEALQTPNLDRICAQSTAFHAAYCQAPVCGPSRASFMSGKTPHQSQVFENATRFYDNIDPQDMWPAKLKQAGYFCSAGGKVHHGRGFTKDAKHALYSDSPKLFGSLGGLPPKFAHVKTGGWRKGYALTNESDIDKLYDSQSAESAISFLQSHPADQPFYREIGFTAPHGPFITTLAYKKVYNADNFTQPAQWGDPFDPCLFEPTQSKLAFDPAHQSLQFWQNTVRSYFSALTHADYQLGRIWDELKASVHADNTIVIITSDHGFHLGERHRIGKTTLWEQVANVPLILHDPSHPEPAEITDPVALLDIGQTALDYAGLPPLEDCVGQSLRPYVEGKEDAERTVPTFHFDNVSVRKGNYRLIRYEDGRTQFYDLTKDPWQYKSLGTEHPDYAAVYQSLCEVSAEYGHVIQ